MDYKDKYRVGDAYRMHPKEIRKDSRGNDYIAVQDPDDADGHEFRIYTNLKCLYECLPETLPVVLKSRDIYDRRVFELDIKTLYHNQYREGKMYGFVVVSCHTDAQNGKQYYIIEDDFATHRYYTDEDYEIGDSCILEVTGFTNKGFLKLRKVNQQQPSDDVVTVAVSSASQVEPQDTNWRNAPVLEVGDECTTIEFKTSIAFPPGDKKEADIDCQLDNIITVICAFMNAEGGTLYIGVHDATKRIVGIAADYEHLNDGNDIFAGNYSKNHDGYELKIRNAIDYKCSGFANSLIEFSFHKVGDVEYCQIDVHKPKRPVWFNGTQLWVKQGNRKKQLKGDEITFFLYENMKVYIPDRIDFESMEDGQQIKDYIVGLFETLSKEMRRAKPQATVPVPAPRNLDEIDYWINWDDDGTWKRTREKATDSQYAIQVAVPRNISNPMVVFCYDDGRVNVVSLSDLRRNTRMNECVTAVRKTWPQQVRPMDIFIAPQASLLVGYSIDEHAVEYVKFHTLTDYTPTQSAANAGAPFVPDNYRMRRFCIVSVAHCEKLRALQCPRNQRSSNPGVPLSSEACQQVINQLSDIIQSA